MIVSRGRPVVALTVPPQEQFTTSIALSRGLILVTRKARHFRRVPELAVESWIDAT